MDELDKRKLGDIQAAIEAGMKMVSTDSVSTDDSTENYIIPEGFKITSVKNRAENPDRKTGLRTFVSAKSFCSYVNKHKIEDQTIIVADESRDVISAVLNDHGENPEWGDFQADLKLEKSRQWKEWVSGENSFMGQEEFAQFIEDNRPDFMCGGDSEGISAVELTQLILNLNITVNEKLESKLDPHTGERVYSYSNEQDGKCKFKTPKTFILAIPIFKNGDIFQITVNLRRRMNDGSARFGFLIDQKDERIEKAFGMVCDRITAGQASPEEGEADHGLPVYEGTGVEVYRGNL